MEVTNPFAIGYSEYLSSEKDQAFMLPEEYVRASAAAWVDTPTSEEEIKDGIKAAEAVRREKLKEVGVMGCSVYPHNGDEVVVYTCIPTTRAEALAEAIAWGDEQTDYSADFTAQMEWLESNPDHEDATEMLTCHSFAPKWY